MHLPIGVSDFRKLIEYKDPSGIGYLYVDKTSLIKEIIYDLTEVIIITRPRRFGKTLNLSMLRYFYADKVDGSLTNALFNGLEISKQPECMLHQGQYPVFFISLKDAKYKTFNLCYKHIKDQIINIYSEYNFLLASDKLTIEDKNFFKKILSNHADQVEFDGSIKSLTKFIHKATGQQSVILIDEYDTPIQEAYLNGYYDELMPFIRNLFSSGLKDNSFVKKAILTGILRVSKESLFSGLSNVKVYSVLHGQYSNYFGFTVDEINNLLIKAKLPSDLAKAKEWYNGYNFGGTTIYNPWSIIEFIKERGQLSPYWINTSGNYLIRELFINSDSATQEKIGQLIAGDVVKELVNEHIVFQDLENSRAAIWSLLVMSGYLKVLSSDFTEYGNLCELSIPNKEVEFLYKQIFREWLSGSRGIIWYQELLIALTEGKVSEFENKLQSAIESMASYHDTKRSTQEIFYQGLMLGILSGLKDNYEIKSNRESGLGRYDLMVIPKESNKLGIIMEFKAVDKASNLEYEAKSALEQISKLKYCVELQSRGINNICQIGVAFSGKNIKMVSV